MSNQPFHIGLCMAGAVSAGAYTAGVMDFLTEALDTWEKKKTAGEKNVPRHKVQLSVMGGASAGGMTSIIAAAAFSNTIVPVKLAAQTGRIGQQPQNKFFNAWVDLLADDMLPVMLGNGDIQSGKKASSVLNSDFIAQIAARMVAANAADPVKRNYLADEMLLFTTMSNLEGFHYDLGFRTNTPGYSRYLTTAHNDLALFRYALHTPAYQDDGFIPLSFIDNTHTDIARTAAMATGAFPLGLAARTVKRPAKFVNDARDFINHTAKAGFVPADQDYEACYVDGGLINNEPFDVTRRMLHRFTGESGEKKNYRDFKSTVLMIDPFPSQPASFTPNLDLLGVTGKTLSTMIGQLRFKPDDIEAAFDPQDASRYLISPSRNRYGLPLDGEKAIACGTMSGFGGFLHRSFRVHDYFLGRRNCQKFLKDIFTVPASSMNPIFEEGYQEIPDTKPFLSSDGKSLQIIPVFVIAEEKEPDWPVIAFSEIERYESPLKTRLEKVIFSTLDLNAFDKILGLIGSRVLIRRKMGSAVMTWVKNSLTEHELLR
ncbi:MAG: patatin-like phospholipase family protein [Mucilaginibacter polytrichastri]|nr:patatin-like phospholipase family protein [Mucilaginibacter polytrichastri]